MIVNLDKLNIIEEMTKWKDQFQKLNPDNQKLIQRAPFRKSSEDLAKGVQSGTIIF